MDPIRVGPVSTRTFGPGATLAAPKPSVSPPLQRSRSTPEEQKQGPERPLLLRGRTPETEQSQQEAATMYSRAMFADPPTKRAYFRGPPVFTDGHQRLVYILREECARLYGYSQRLKSQLGTAENTAHHAKGEVAYLKVRLAEMRTQMAQYQQRIREQNEELADNAETLADLDATYQATRNKRMSRNLADKS